MEQPREGRLHIDEDQRPQRSHDEGQRKPARGHRGVESKDVDNYRCQQCDRQRYVAVHQQKYTSDELDPEDHPQVMRDIEGAYELSSNAFRRRLVNKVQEAVQPKNKKDHARQISGDYGSGFHNRSPFRSAPLHGVKHIDINISDAVYFWEIQVFMARGTQETDHVWLVMMKAMRALTRYAASGIEETGLGLSDFAVLEVLLHKGPLPVNTIGPVVDLTPGSISIAVDRLFAKALVSRVESAEDRRVRIVALTPRGKDLIVSAFRKHSGQMKRVFSELSPEELRGLEVTLKKVGKRAAALMEES
jgi:MarR family transcriptional regulator, 2-MHQ and catechol-resistance regulon repressor